MGANRIELSGFTDAMRDRLRAYGLFHEIISWKLRMFVPTDTTAAAILTKVLERYPVERTGAREAAWLLDPSPPTWPFVSTDRPRRCSATNCRHALARAALDRTTRM